MKTRHLKDYKNYEIYKNDSPYYVEYYGKRYDGEYTGSFKTIEELKAVIDDDKRSETDCVYYTLYGLYSDSKINLSDIYDGSIYAYCAGYMPRVSISSIYNALMRLREDLKNA